MRALRASILLCLSLLLVACPTARRPEQTPPEQPVGAVPSPYVAGARTFAVVPEQSLVRILVYRGGTMSSAGHNHVIASHDVSGKVYVHKEVAKSGFELVMPVDSLKVDEPELRQQEGADFAPQVADSAREGTHKNMVGDALLNAAQYPSIKLTSTAVSGTPQALEVTAVVEIRDQRHEIHVPVAVENSGKQLTATGEFKVKQTELGLKPFSVLLGALTVQDDLTVKFRIVAAEQGQ